MLLAGFLCLLVLSQGGVSKFSSTPDLRSVATQCGVYVGSAANYGYLQSDSTYSSVLHSQYDLITAEDGCKFGPTEPNENQYDWTQCDYIKNYAQQYNQIFRGHNLVWGVYNPSWLVNGGFSSSQLTQILENHVTTVIQHYGNSAYSWDVVNEAVSDNPSQGTFKDNVWYPAVTNYVDVAFHTARQANSGVKLFYNDYNIGSSSGWEAAKSNAVYNMIVSMKNRGIPIDGIGLQFHIDLSYNLFSGVTQNFQRLAALGLEIHITELDISCSPCDSSQLQTQASIYAQLLSICLNEYACKSFETWGFTDKYTWLGTSNHPLPFDENFQPKPAFWSLYDGFSNCTKLKKQ